MTCQASRQAPITSIPPAQIIPPASIASPLRRICPWASSANVPIRLPIPWLPTIRPNPAAPSPSSSLAIAGRMAWNGAPETDSSAR